MRQACKWAIEFRRLPGDVTSPMDRDRRLMELIGEIQKDAISDSEEHTKVFGEMVSAIERMVEVAQDDDVEAWQNAVIYCEEVVGRARKVVGE